MAVEEKQEAVLDEALIAEIDAGVDQIVAEKEEQRAQEEVEDSGSSNNDNATQSQVDDDVPGDDDVDGGDDSSNDDGSDETDAVTDDHIERAIGAGMTMAEARQFKSGDLLDAMINRIQNDPDSSSDGKDDYSEESGENDLLNEIPDLDPDEYDEKIVDGFKAMKDIIQRQQETIKNMQKGQDGTNPDWLELQILGLDKPVAKAVKSDPTKLEAIRKKISVLQAGYEASGEDVGREAIFQEAVSITMGDVIAQSAVDKKSRSLQKRSAQHINRPGGVRAEAKGDPIEEVGAEIDSKYFKN